MKRIRSTQLHTPIKKWQQMSPMEDELAIVQSDISSPEQPELFNALVGPSPFEQTPHISSHRWEQEEEESLSSFPFSPQESMEEEVQQAVSEMKVEEPKTQERIPLKQLDSNRKGCNCRHSKCEKNYCDCLRMGQVCEPGLCSCEDCHNQEEKEIHREIIKKLQLPQTETKGCRCKKSKCLKKYCECHSAGRKCSPLCECIQCFNRDENARPQGAEDISLRLRRANARPIAIY